MKTPILKLTALLPVIAFIGFQPARATVSADYHGYVQSGETTFDSFDTTGDVIYNGQPITDTTLGSQTASTGGANDGAASSNGSLGNDYFANPFPQTLTFNLNLDPATGGNLTGYNITSIQSIAGWENAGFAAQNFTLYVTTTTDPTFFQIGTTSFDNSSGAVFSSPSSNVPQSSETTLTDSTGTIASNVTALEFVYSAPSTSFGGTVVREIEVYGDAAPLPEPSTYALLLGGLGLLLARFRRRSA
jgi:hypothetical protein